jgi:hypothetical protein
VARENAVAATYVQQRVGFLERKFAGDVVCDGIEPGFGSGLIKRTTYLLMRIGVASLFIPEVFPVDHAD